jgi:hypothetical protein
MLSYGVLGWATASAVAQASVLSSNSLFCLLSCISRRSTITSEVAMALVSSSNWVRWIDACVLKAWVVPSNKAI